MISGTRTSLCYQDIDHPHLQIAWVEDAPEWEYKISVMVAWIILRSLSFSLEVCDTDPDSSTPHSSLLITLLGYCLYLPFLCTGPYMPYTDFRAGVSIGVCVHVYMH